MSILEKLISVIAPHDCIGCGTEGALLCAGCCETLSVSASICYRCEKTSDNGTTCLDCLPSTKLLQLITVTRHEDLGKVLIWRLKFTGAQAAAGLIAHRMSLAHKPNKHTLVVPVPTATSRARQRGYDQAVLIAKEYAKLTKSEHTPCLARLGQQHQRGANRRERLLQTTGMYRLKRGSQVAGRSILLVDDVTTTGSTLHAAAGALHQAGASTIAAIAFAQA